jgi:energy-coupling factor transporter transmembrane protein EcfT
VKPLPAALPCGALLLLAVTADHPLILAAVALSSLFLLLAAPPPHAPYIWFAVLAGGLVVAINPFVGLQGLTPLWRGPDIPLLDSEVTAEELAFGAAAALRIIGSALAVSAFIRLVDGDMLARDVARVAPRSAMIGSLGARLLPTLERDAAGIVLAARGRGVELRRRRTATELVAPLVSLSLERSGRAPPARRGAPTPASGCCSAPAWRWPGWSRQCLPARRRTPTTTFWTTR